MDKNILRKFATQSRQDLMKKIENKIKLFYINEEFSIEQTGDIYVLSNETHFLNLSKQGYEKRELLIKRVQELGINQVIEEAAYTWFNRIVAIRYMEVNGYLPLTKDNQNLGIRVLSSKDNTPDPEIMKFTNLINSELDIDFEKEKYIELKDNNEKFKYVLLLICEKIGKVIPQVFGGITDYIDILIPDYLLTESGFVTKIVTEIPEENYKQVEIIGWLYQYYNQEEKDKVISVKKAYEKNEIPYVTQLFTPNWIVKYMVENSLGRYWVEHSNNDLIINDWKYFIKDNFEKKNERITPIEISFIDPCCGSGHILVYAFEVLYKIYESVGYNKNDIAELILKNNLYGLDIDNRAGQLSILSVLLKAREYDKNIFNKNIIKDIHIHSIQESNNISLDSIENIKNEEAKNIAKYLIEAFYNAKEIGSLLKLKEQNFDYLLKELQNDSTIFGIDLRKKFHPLIKVAQILTKKYNIVVTNPPYLNSSSMSKSLKKYLQKNYCDSKTDLCTSFMEIDIGKNSSYMGMINQHGWMFLSSFKKLRKKIVENYTINNMIHLGTHAFEEIGGEVVQTTSFVLENKNINRKSIFIRLIDFENASEKERKFRIIKENKEQNYYKRNLNMLNSIPGIPIAYWCSDKIFSIFKNNNSVGFYAPLRQGLITGDNNRFLRLWFEVEADLRNKKWFNHNKGGEFRRWYGNREYLINWENDGYEIKNYKNMEGKLLSRPQNLEFNFKNAISWSMINTGKFSARYYDNSFTFNVAGLSCFPEEKYIYYILGLFNTKVVNKITKILNPTINMNIGDIAKIPIIIKELERVNDLVVQNIEISKQDWDSFETSWDFTEHPLLKNKIMEKPSQKLSDIYLRWEEECNNRFNKLQSNEEELNHIFIETYGLQDELTIEVEDKDITIRKADKEREVKSLISYAIGCMFGRYSLNEQGLIYAGGQFNINRYKLYKPDMDNIIPITEELYFENDIVNKLKKFIEIVYGKEYLNDNIDYIAEALGKKGTETSEETIRRYFINDFYLDHIKIYQKRPIYWLFDTGRKNGFKALIYMHRYNDNTIAKIRLDYLHRVQTTYEKMLNDIKSKLTNELSVIDKKEAQKCQIELNAKLQEVKQYDEKIAYIANERININLDDGVITNYAKFSDVLSKIK